MILVILLAPPLYLLLAEFWVTATCQRWPHWAKGCEVHKQFFINGDLDERIKKLEERKP